MSAGLKGGKAFAGTSGTHPGGIPGGTVPDGMPPGAPGIAPAGIDPGGVATGGNTAGETAPGERLLCVCAHPEDGVLAGLVAAGAALACSAGLEITVDD